MLSTITLYCIQLFYSTGDVYFLDLIDTSVEVAEKHLYVGFEDIIEDISMLHFTPKDNVLDSIFEYSVSFQ